MPKPQNSHQPRPNRRGLDEKDLANPQRISPRTFLCVLALIIGGLILATTLTLNFFYHILSIPLLVAGIALIALSIIGLLFGNKAE